MGCEHDARWALAQIAHEGTVVRRLPAGPRFRAITDKTRHLTIQWQRPFAPVQEGHFDPWQETAHLGTGPFEIVQPEPAQPDMPEGYERWERSVWAGVVKFYALNRAHYDVGEVMKSDRFGYLVFERTDDSGKLHVLYSRCLHAWWNTQEQRLVQSELLRDGGALDNVEVVAPTAVLMLKEKRQ